MNVLFDLTRKLSKIIINDDDLKSINNICKSNYQNIDFQKKLLSYSLKNKLAPWMYVQFKKYRVDKYLNQSIIDDFDKHYQIIKTQNSNRNKQAQIFLNEFKKQNIDVVVLKGNLFMHTVYKDVGYKKMNDFDIMIHSNDWTKVQDIYLKLKYIPLGFGWSGERQKPAKYSHVGLSFLSSDYHCIVGTQWGLKSPTASFKVDNSEIWSLVENFDFYGINIKKLSPEYNLLHLILHLGLYKCSTRDLMDIYNLLLVENKFSEDRAIDIINNSKAREKAYFALKLSDSLSNTVSKSFLSKLKPVQKHFVSKRLNSRLKTIEKSGDIHNAYNDYFQDIEKNVIYFNLFPKFHHKLKFLVSIIKQIWFPDQKIALKLMDYTYRITKWKKIKARIKAPYFVFALLSQEIGWIPTILLYNLLFINQLLSLKNYLIKKDSYFDYLEKKGINPKKIKNIVTNIQ